MGLIGCTPIYYKTGDKTNELISLIERSASYLEIPPLTSSIGNYAFYNNSAFNTVSIPSSVTRIGTSAFYGSGLTDIELPSGLVSIGSYAFAQTPLKRITIPSGVLNLEQNMMTNCSRLISVILKKGVKWINNIVFANCSSLRSVFIPSSVTSISSGAFNTNTMKFYVYDNTYAKTFCINQNKNFVIVGDTDDFLYDAFNGNVSIFSYTGVNTALAIPPELNGNPVVAIAPSTFLNNASLTEIHFMPNLLSVGDMAFKGCTALEQVEYFREYETLTSIGTQAFADCTSLVSFALPNTLQAVAADAFEGCSALTDIKFGTNFNASIDLSASTNYTEPQMLAWLNSLKNRSDTTANTLTIGAVNIAKLTINDLALATAKNWNLA